MRKKLLSVLLVMSMSVLLLAGCGEDPNDPLSGYNKDQLKELYYAKESETATIQAQYDSLNTMYQALSTENLPTDAIALVGDGSGQRYSFNSTDSKIIFPTSFQYPDSAAIASTGRINIVDNVSIAPGTNWLCKMNGSTLELEHSSLGISATIKVNSINQTYQGNLEEDVISPWFQKVTNGQVAYKPIFIESNNRGTQATVPTMIDQENAYLRCGMVGMGAYAVTYVVVYRGDQDSTKEESVVNLINSIEISGAKVVIEN